MNECDLQERTVTIEWNIRKKDLQLFATKLTEKKYLILVMVKKNINHFQEKKLQNQ